MMKNLKYLTAFLLATTLFSCVDTEQKIVLNTDGSGTYTMTIDMGRMLKLAGSMTGEKTNTEGIKEKKDTILYLKNIIDTAANLTAREKALYKNGLIQVHMDEAKNEMKVVISSPFKNTADLVEMKRNFSAVLNKMKAFDIVDSDNPKSANENDNLKMGSNATDPINDQFTFKAGNGQISNTITDIEAFKKLVATDSTISMMTQMTGMMGDLNYSTTIVVPRVIKSYKGPESILSANKKAITFYTTFSEIINHPEKAAYQVEY